MRDPNRPFTTDDKECYSRDGGGPFQFLCYSPCGKYAIFWNAEVDKVPIRKADGSSLTGMEQFDVLPQKCSRIHYYVWKRIPKQNHWQVATDFDYGALLNNRFRWLTQGLEVTEIEEKELPE